MPLNFEMMLRYMLCPCILNNHSITAYYTISFISTFSGCHNTAGQNSFQRIRTSIFTCKEVDWFQGLCAVITNKNINWYCIIWNNLINDIINILSSLQFKWSCCFWWINWYLVPWIHFCRFYLMNHLYACPVLISLYHLPLLKKPSGYHSSGYHSES